MVSMNRFCDDLIEDILCYLSFEEKFKYQSVCRQWKRCLYKRQTLLIIDGNKRKNGIKSCDSLNQLIIESEEDNIPNKVTVLRKNSFKSVLKICPSIRKLKILGCSCDDQVLQIIGEECPQLEDLELELLSVDPFDNNLHKLGEKLGKTLKSFRCDFFTISFDSMKTFLNLCSKLEVIHCNVFPAIVDRRPNFLPKVSEVYVEFGPSDEQYFETLGEKYSKTLKSLTLRGNGIHLPPVLKNISRITSLNCLEIKDNSSDTSAEEWVKNIDIIAKELKCLNRLMISSKRVQISEELFKSLCQFKSLTKLTLNQKLIQRKSIKDLGISHLSDCKSLRHLSIIGFNLSELFFSNISLYLPNLRSIEFSLMTAKNITKKLFHNFENINTLEKLSIKISDQSNMPCSLIETIENGLCSLISTCPNLRIIEAKNIFSLNQMNDQGIHLGKFILNSMITKAKNNKRMKFILNLSLEYNNKYEIRQIGQEYLPKNLTYIKQVSNGKSNDDHFIYSRDYFDQGWLIGGVFQNPH